MEITETTGIWGESHPLPKQLILKYPILMDAFLQVFFFLQGLAKRENGPSRGEQRMMMVVVVSVGCSMRVFVCKENGPSQNLGALSLRSDLERPLKRTNHNALVLGGPS